jgi:hypothetical protein
MDLFKICAKLKDHILELKTQGPNSNEIKT